MRWTILPPSLAFLPAVALAQTAEPKPGAPARRAIRAARAGAARRARDRLFMRGCLAGALALPVDGKTWQVMRLSRNRNWGHPSLIQFLERFSAKVPQLAGWPGILVGDLSQPRGGPMLTGHTSHQVGLDADIWLTPMPTRTFSRDEREQLSASMMVRADRRDIDPAAWNPGHLKVIKAAATIPRLNRIFVNAAIKKALCRGIWQRPRLAQWVRPCWGHDFHMHVRIRCPADSPNCKAQDVAPDGDGCGKDLDWWFGSILHPQPPAKAGKAEAADDARGSAA